MQPPCTCCCRAWPYHLGWWQGKRLACGSPRAAPALKFRHNLSLKMKRTAQRSRTKWGALPPLKFHQCFEQGDFVLARSAGVYWPAQVVDNQQGLSGEDASRGTPAANRSFQDAITWWGTQTHQLYCVSFMYGSGATDWGKLALGVESERLNALHFACACTQTLSALGMSSHSQRITFKLFVGTFSGLVQSGEGCVASKKLWPACVGWPLTTSPAPSCPARLTILASQR